MELAGTLLQLAGRPVPDGMHAGSLLAGAAAAPEVVRRNAVSAERRLAFARRARRRSLEADSVVGGRAVRRAGDPAETINLASSKASVVDAMRAAARGARHRAGDRRRVGRACRCGGALARAGIRLRCRTQAADTDAAPNPARHIAAWNTFERELTRLTAGDARGALPGLAGLARAFPDAPVFQATYARALKDTGRVREAVDVYRRAVARWPRDATLYHDLAVAATPPACPAKPRVPSRRRWRWSRRIRPPPNGLGLLQIRAAKPADAIASFEQAVKARSDERHVLDESRQRASRRRRTRRAPKRPIGKRSRPTRGRPTPPTAWACCWCRRIARAEAVPWFERALAGSPRFVEALLNLGIAYQESGNTAKAAEQYRRVLELAPHGSREYQAAATLLKSQE